MRLSTFKTPKGKLWKMGGVSCLIHGALIVLFSLTPWDKVIEAQPPVYTVTLTSIVLPPPEPVVPASRREPRAERAKPVEKPTPLPPPKTKEPQKEEATDKAKSVKVKEKPFVQKPSLRRLPEEPDPVMEEIRRIQKKVARREESKKSEEPPPVVRPLPPPLPPLPPLPPSRPSTPPPSTPSPPVASNPSTPSSARLASLRERYFSMVWAKVKDEWKIPKDLEKEMVDLETIVVVGIGKGGKITECRIEKSSLNPQYDELAIRAVRRAEPFPDPREAGFEKIDDLWLRFTSRDYASY